MTFLEEVLEEQETLKKKSAEQMIKEIEDFQEIQRKKIFKLLK